MFTLPAHRHPFRSVAIGLGAVLALGTGAAVASNADLLWSDAEPYAGVAGVDERGLAADALAAQAQQVQGAVAEFFADIPAAVGGSSGGLTGGFTGGSVGGLPGADGSAIDGSGGEGAGAELPEIGGTLATDGYGLPNPAGGDPAGNSGIDLIRGRDLVNVVLSNLQFAGDTVAASGYVPVIELGGICTLRLENPSGQLREIQSFAFADVSTVICSELAMPVSELTPGVWLATLAYESAGSIGASAPQELVVP